MRSSSSLRLAVALGVSLGLLAGCGTDPSPNAQSASVDLLEVQRSELLGGASPQVLADAEVHFLRLQQQSIASCMESSGFEYAVDVPSIKPEMFADYYDRSYAQDHGFGVAENFLGLSNANEATADAHDPNTQTAYGNTPEYSSTYESCMVAATKDVNEREGLAIIKQRSSEVHDAIRADPEVVAAATEWAACAASVGYTAPDRLSLINDFVQRASQTPPGALETLRDEEVAAAVATFDCSEVFSRIWRGRGEVVGEELLGDGWTG